MEWPVNLCVKHTHAQHITVWEIEITFAVQFLDKGVVWVDGGCHGVAGEPVVQYSSVTV